MTTATAIRPRVLMADDHILLLEGLYKVLTPDFDVVGTVTDGRAVLDVAASLQPDVVLLDISMQNLNGLDAARQLRKMMPHVKILIVTMHADPAYAVEALRLGVLGYVLKQSAASELVQAIREVLKDHQYVTPLISKQVLTSLLEASPASPVSPGGNLTPRQREVLQLVAEGHSMKEIAAILKISVKTVELHKSAIMTRIGVRSTAELTQYAMAMGLVTSHWARPI